MARSLLCAGRAALATHPSFGSAEAPEGAMLVGDDPARIALEGSLFHDITSSSHVTPFLGPLDEATVYVGDSGGFQRLRARPQQEAGKWNPGGRMT